MDVGISLQRNILPNGMKGILIGRNGASELTQRFDTTALLSIRDLKLKVVSENPRAEKHMKRYLKAFVDVSKESKALRSLEIHWVNYYILQKEGADVA